MVLADLSRVLVCSLPSSPFTEPSQLQAFGKAWMVHPVHVYMHRECCPSKKCPCSTLPVPTEGSSALGARQGKTELFNSNFLIIIIIFLNSNYLIQESHTGLLSVPRTCHGAKQQLKKEQKANPLRAAFLLLTATLSWLPNVISSSALGSPGRHPWFCFLPRRGGDGFEEQAAGEGCCSWSSPCPARRLPWLQVRYREGHSHAALPPCASREPS